MNLQLNQQFTINRGFNYPTWDTYTWHWTTVFEYNWWQGGTHNFYQFKKQPKDGMYFTKGTWSKVGLNIGQTTKQTK